MSKDKYETNLGNPYLRDFFTPSHLGFIKIKGKIENLVLSYKDPTVLQLNIIYEVTNGRGYNTDLQEKKELENIHELRNHLGKMEMETLGFELLLEEKKKNILISSYIDKEITLRDIEEKTIKLVEAFNEKGYYLPSQKH
jgi:hypothetical protein